MKRTTTDDTYSLFIMCIYMDTRQNIPSLLYDLSLRYEYGIVRVPVTLRCFDNDVEERENCGSAETSPRLLKAS